MWMDFGHMGFSSGYGGMLGIAPMLLWGALLLVGIALLAKWLFGAATAGRRFGREDAGELLAERYARGEIDREEFQKRKGDLSG